MISHGETGTSFKEFDGKVQWELCLKLNELLIRCKEKLFCHKHSEQIAQSDCAVSIVGVYQHKTACSSA